MAWREWVDRIPNSAFFAGACALFLAIALAMAALVNIFSGSIWSLGDTRIFFHMADVILQGGTPYVDFKDPKPPLIFFLLTLTAAGTTTRVRRGCKTTMRFVGGSGCWAFGTEGGVTTVPGS